MSSHLVQYFLQLKGEVALEEAENELSSVLDLRSLQMQVVPAKLNVPNKTFQKRIRKIFLQNNSLTILPHSWGYLFPSLRSLSLDGNQLKCLPDTLALANGLTFLNIGHNDFSEKGFPLVICGLNNLRTLWANSIKVKEIPKEIAELKKLEVLGLRNNGITNLVPQICQLKSLIHLSLSDNRLAEIPESIADLTTLVHLNMDNNRISQLPDSSIFEKLSELRYISLRNNYIEVKPKFLQSFRSIRKLKWVKLDGNPQSSTPALRYNRGKVKPILFEIPKVTPTRQADGENVTNMEETDVAPGGNKRGIRFCLGLSPEDLSGGGPLCVSLPVLPDVTSECNQSEEQRSAQSAVLTRDLGHESGSNGPLISNRSNLSQSRVRNWLMSTQEDFLDSDSDDVIGNGGRVAMVPSQTEDEGQTFGNSQDETEMSLHSKDFTETTSLAEDSRRRALIDLDSSDLGHSPRSSEMDDLDSDSSLSTFEADFIDLGVDFVVRDLNLILPRIL